MMHQLKIHCDESSSFGKLTLKTDEHEVVINKSKTFYFENETEVELICTPFSECELVEVVNSQNFSMNNNSVCHYLRINGELKITPIFRQIPKTSHTGIGFLQLTINEGGGVNIKSEHQNFHHTNKGSRSYPINKNTLIELQLQPNDGYEVSFVKSNYEKYQLSESILFNEDDVRVEVEFKDKQNTEDSDLQQAPLDVIMSKQQDIEYQVEQVVQSFDEPSVPDKFSVTVVVDQDFGDIMLKTETEKVFIKETQTFNFKTETEIELLCTPKSDKYELVEVINSTNFSMNNNSVCHYIKVNSELEVTPIFRQKLKNTDSELIYIRVSTNDGGVVNFKGHNQNFSHDNQGIRAYPINKNTLIELQIQPNDGYEVSFVKSNYEKYQLGGGILFQEDDAWLEVRFDKVVVIDEELLTNTNSITFDTTKLATTTKLISDTHKDNLFVENIVKTSQINSSEDTPTPTIKADFTKSFEFDFKPRHSPDLDGEYICNFKKIHNIILYRGETYCFSALHDRASFELLDINYELYSDEQTENPVFTVDSDFVFTPNNQTPPRLLLRSRHRKDRVITLSVMNNHFYGNASSASSLLDAVLEITSDDAVDFSNTNNLGELIIQSKPNIYSIVSEGGVDQVTGIRTNLKYESPIGSTQLNALTTLVSAIYEENTFDIVQINEMFSRSLAFNPSQNICVDNIVQNIIDGNSSYFTLHKIQILTDAMLNIANKLGHYDKFKKILANRFLKNRLVLFNGDEFLDETLGRILNKNTKEEVISIVKKLFSYVLNTEVESAFYNWYKLFAFHYVFNLKFLDNVENIENLNSEWNNFAPSISDAFSVINKVKIPTELVLEECEECKMSTKNFNTLLDNMKITLSDSTFSKLINDEFVFSENTFKFVYNKILKVTYTTETSCYEVKKYPVNYYEALKSVDAYDINYTFDNLFSCTDTLSPHPSEEQAEEEPDEISFNFSLVESGNSTVMLEHNIKKNDLLVESLGKNEYRIYIDEPVGRSTYERTSPGYIKVPKQFAIPMQQHYIRIGYKSGVQKKLVTNVVDNEKTIRVVTTYWSTKLQKLVCIVATPINIVVNDVVEFSNSSFADLNGTYSVSDILTDTTFVVDLIIDKDFDNYDDITSNVKINSGVRVYCDVSDFEVSDMVLFSGHKNYPTQILNKSSDEFGDFIVVQDEFLTAPNHVIKSHAIENRDEVIDFMFTQKQIYYETTESDYIEDRLWLTYDPDPDPDGRLNQKISYIQIFYNKDF
jgi:hypothetical protein